MARKDIYDDIPDGDAQREYNRKRLAQLERESAARRERIAQVLAYAELAAQAIQPPVKYAL